MRFTQNQQSNCSILTRETKQKPVLPELMHYLTENHQDSLLNGSNQPNSQENVESSERSQESSKINREFQAFRCERDSLGKLMKRNKSTGSMPSVLNSELQMNCHFSSRDSPSQTPRDATFSPSKLKLNRVAVMHLNEFFNEKVRSSRQSIENIKKDMILDGLGTDRDIVSGSSSDFYSSARIISPGLGSAVIPLKQKSSSSVHSQSPPIPGNLDFMSLFKYKNNQFSDQTAKFINDVAMLYTQPRQKLALLRKQEESQPSVGQYDTSNFEAYRFQKVPSTFIRREGYNQKSTVKLDKVDIFMRKEAIREQQNRDAKKRTKERPQQKEEHYSLPSIKLKEPPVPKNQIFEDNDVVFDKMSNEFYKYPQEFLQKMKYAQKKALYIKSELSSWEKKCKELLTQVPQNPLDKSEDEK